MNGNFRLFTNWPQPETQCCCKSQRCCFHTQGPSENRPKKDFSVTHLSCLQSLVSALVITETTSQPLVRCPCELSGFSVRASRHWAISSGVLITSKTKQQQNPNDTAQQNKIERAAEWSLENISKPQHFLALSLAHFAHIQIPLTMPPNSQDYGELSISNICQSAQHMVGTQ